MNSEINLNRILLMKAKGDSGVLVLTGISSVLILREKLKKNQMISMIVGVAAIVLMNL